MRQVNRDELGYVIASALRTAPASFIRLLVDRRGEEQRRGRGLLALHIADSFPDYEILSNRDLPALMGETAYSTPMARMLGAELPSGVIPARDDMTDPDD